MPYFTLGQTDGSPESCSYIGIDAKDVTGQRTLETLGCKVISTDGVTARYCCPKSAAELLPPDIRETVTKIGQGLFRIPSDMLTRVQQTLAAQQAGLAPSDPSLNPAAPPPPVDIVPANVAVTEQVFPQQTLGSRLLSAVQAHPIISLGGAALAIYLGTKWWTKQPAAPTARPTLGSSMYSSPIGPAPVGSTPEEQSIMRNPARLDPNHRLTWVGGRFFEVQTKRNKGWKKIGGVQKVDEGTFRAHTSTGGRATYATKDFHGPHAAARWVVAKA